MSKISFHRLFFGLLIPAFLLLAGPAEAGSHDPIRIISPSDGAVIPRNLEKLTVTWEGGQENNKWTLHLSSGSANRTYEADGQKALINTDISKGRGDLSIRICPAGVSTDSGRCSSPVTVRISKDDLKDTILYRVVDPLFNPSQTSMIKKAQLDTGRQTNIIENNTVCIGCHAFSSKGHLALNVKMKKDRRLIVLKLEGKKFRLLDSKKIGEFAFMSWSPDARKMAVVVNTFGVIDIKPDIVEPFGLTYQTGDLAIYDLETGKVTPLPGASEMDYVEDMPAWSPDGRELMFVRYKSHKDKGTSEMGIYKIPFNGGRGGKPEPVLVPKTKDEFFYYPNYSQNGKWISFTKGDGSRGVFARRTSDIYISDSSGNNPRKLSINIDEKMDSWHRWSSDDKWLIFSAKRASNITSLFLSHVSKAGETAPPVLIAELEGAKVNIPEFVYGGIFGIEIFDSLSEVISKVYSEKK